MFETTVEVLTADPYSLLAAICRRKSPIRANGDGVFYFDRDWWLFRHILSYLRSGVVPRELDVLKELYKEASFYRLEKLQRAIEEIPVDQVINYSPAAYVAGDGAGILAELKAETANPNHIYRHHNQAGTGGSSLSSQMFGHSRWKEMENGRGLRFYFVYISIVTQDLSNVIR